MHALLLFTIKSKKIKRLMTVNGSNLFEKTKKKSINFSPPKHLNHHQLLLLKKKKDLPPLKND